MWQNSKTQNSNSRCSLLRSRNVLICNKKVTSDTRSNFHLLQRGSVTVFFCPLVNDIFWNLIVKKGFYNLKHTNEQRFCLTSRASIDDTKTTFHMNTPFKIQYFNFILKPNWHGTNIFFQLKVGWCWMGQNFKCQQWLWTFIVTQT